VIIPILSTIVAVIGSVFVAYYTSRSSRETAPADAAAKITEAATDLLEPYRVQVQELSARLDKTEKKLGDTELRLSAVSTSLSFANARVAALESQVRSLGADPVRL
jgi:uncharacterized protein HemX